MGISMLPHILLLKVAGFLSSLIVRAKTKEYETTSKFVAPTTQLVLIFDLIEKNLSVRHRNWFSRHRQRERCLTIKHVCVREIRQRQCIGGSSYRYNHDFPANSFSTATEHWIQLIRALYSQFLSVYAA
ncbi:uncharacterized protein ARMOST_21087 [Armillaria ostoyae]|uniref:Secreted protein n=1 Tax=Armillaria ostoyae TaxID=47428 RepID=A0A284S964_ARMOS|nr:uncharacterized protein ARMOST_21087 [Armillaria ostoyae]